MGGDSHDSYVFVLDIWWRPSSYIRNAVGIANLSKRRS